MGNRSSEVLTTGSVATRTYAYPGANNKLSSITEGANVRSFGYDGEGIITSDDRAGSVYNYRYNNRGRLDQLSLGATVSADYIYDGLERLAVRTTQSPAVTTHYVYDRGGRLIAEAHGNGVTAREYVWLDDMPIAVITDVDTVSPQLLFVHADHLDRPLKMTDGSQAVMWDAVFKPFGDAVSITGAAANNQRFPGQYFLIESGLHYNWHRHYDPTTGRYTQLDPLGFVDGPSVYRYALSAPTTYFDPNGAAAVKGPSGKINLDHRVRGEGGGGGVGPGIGHNRPPSDNSCYTGDTRLQDLYFYNSIKGPNTPSLRSEPKTAFQKAMEFIRATVGLGKPFQ